MHTHIIKVNDAQQQSPLHLAVIRAHKHKQSKEDVDICREILERVREAAEVNVHMDAHASRYLHSDRPIERDIDGCIVVQMDSMQHLERVGESAEVGDSPIDQTRASVPASMLARKNSAKSTRASARTYPHTHPYPRQVLAASIQVNLSDENGLTPLHWAVLCWSARTQP